MSNKLWKSIRANATVYLFLIPSVLVMLLIVSFLLCVYFPEIVLALPRVFMKNV